MEGERENVTNKEGMKVHQLKAYHTASMHAQKVNIVFIMHCTPMCAQMCASLTSTFAFQMT